MQRLFVYPVSIAILLLALVAGQGCQKSFQAGKESALHQSVWDRLLRAGGASSAKYGADSDWRYRHALSDEVGISATAGSKTTQPPSEPRPAKNTQFDSAGEFPPKDVYGRANYVPGRLVVRFRDRTTRRRQELVIKAMKADIVRVLDGKAGEYLVSLPEGLEVAEAAQRFAMLSDVKFAEPDILHYLDAIPNDTLYRSFDNQPSELQRWYFNGIGDDRNLNAEAAWEITRGNAQIVIAIIDTGIAVNHPDLAANIWVNPAEIPGNGIDDDGNGFVDDVHGWDFYSNDNNANPDLGDGFGGDANVFHGTFVAGCASAVSGNNLGVAGVSWHSKLMALKVFTDDGGAPASAIASAIRYAADNGAHIINMSLGSTVASKVIAAAVQEAWNKGALLVASAGNANSSSPQYPASFKQVISVGGSGSGSVFSGGSPNIDRRASFTQYGVKAVDVVAPAVDIVSTGVWSVNDQQKGYGRAGAFNYVYGNGTSFAAPLVAGEAALLMSQANALGLAGAIDVESFKRVILSGTVDLPDDPTDSPNGGPAWDGRGRVDFLAALEQIGPRLVRPPRAPTKVMGVASGPGAIVLTWKDNATNEQGFRIERAVKSQSGIAQFEFLAEVGPNTTTFLDTTVDSGATYLYRVSAYNVAAQTGARKPATAKASP